MKLTLTSKNINLEVAKIVLSRNNEPSKQELVLSELIRLSISGMVEEPETLNRHMNRLFGISYVNYRSIMHKLTKLGLVERKGGLLHLAPQIVAKYKEIEIIHTTVYEERIIEQNQKNNPSKQEWIKLVEQVNKNKKEKEAFRYKRNKYRAASSGVIKKGYSKNSTAEKILGISHEDCIKYIEAKFTEGMTWDNHGAWHIDHIKPLAIGMTEEEIKKLCHYTNLQPFWRNENLKKSAKYAYPTTEKL